MPYTPFVPYPPQFQDSSSVNLSGGTLEFFLAGTSTPTNIFSDDVGTSLGTSVTLDASGYPASGGNVVTLFRDTDVDLKVVLKDASDVTIWTSDDHDQPVATMFDIVDSNSNFPSAATIEEALLEARGVIHAASSTEGRTSDTTYSNDGDISQFSLVAGAHYRFVIFYPYTHNVGNIKLRLSFSNAALPEYGFYIASASDLTTASGHWTPSTGFSVTTLTDNVSCVIHATGGFQANASTGGTLNLQFAQETSSANTTTAREGRWMFLQRTI